MSEQKKEIRNEQTELNDKELGEVSGGARVLFGRKEMKTCKGCGASILSTENYCEKCKKKQR